MKYMLTFEQQAGTLTVAGTPIEVRGRLTAEFAGVYPRTPEFTGSIADLASHMRKVFSYKYVSASDIETLVRSVLAEQYEVYFRSVNDVRTFTFDRIQII